MNEDAETIDSLLKTGQYQKAAHILSTSLLEGQTSERWNDWATVKLLEGRALEAEGGYRRALDLDPRNLEAMTNLAVLMTNHGRYIEAAPLLDIVTDHAEGSEKEKLHQLLDTCRKNTKHTGEEMNLQNLADRIANLETYLRQRVEVQRPSAIYLGNNLALTRILEQFLMYVDTQDASSAPHFLMYGYWEMSVTNVFRQLVRPGMNVVDVGANLGYYTLLAAAGTGPTGQVHAVEADPHTADLLRKTLALNGYGFVQLHSCAAADKRGEVTLFQCRERQAGNGIIDFQRRRTDATVTIPAVPLDELIVDPVDVMKIDAEGSEPLIFKGMRKLLRCSPNIKIIMEFAPALLQQTATSPIEFLKRIRDAKLKYQVITEQSTVETWPDEKLLELNVYTLLLTPA